MHLILQIIAGPLSGREVVVEEHKVTSVGRAKKAEFATDDNFMSAAHFAVECEPEGCRIRDLNSRNGTKLNGEPVTDSGLHDGDIISAGHTDFAVRIEQVRQKSSRRKKTKQLPPGYISASVARIAKTTTPTGDSVRLRSESAEEVPKPAPADVPCQALPERSEAITGRSRTDQIPIETPSKTTQKPEPALEVSPPPSVSPPPPAMDPYTAATPEGRLLHLLSNQPEPLMALMDATDEPKLLDLLGNSGEEYQSIYKDAAISAIAPYLIRLPPQSALLKQLVHDGWGKGWGVYLTCRLALKELREYFRQALMVTTPDGMELFSRFYDPVFFRGFLETSTRAEADRFFGPIRAYLMEAEKPEILLEFTKSSSGVEKRGHLLTTLE